MARKRMLTPTIWGDPSFNKLSHSARLLVIGMISHADDYGRERGDSGSLRRNIFGFDEFLPEGVHMATLIDELKKEMGRTVHFYEIKDEEYYHFTNWSKYQKQQTDRMQASEYPMCSKCVADAKQVPTEVKLGKEKVSKGKRREEKVESVAVATSTPKLEMIEFVENPEKQDEVVTFMVSKGADPTWVRREISKFISHWTEKTKTGARQRWELEKAFEVRRRLARWFNNAVEWGDKGRAGNKYQTAKV